MSKAPDNFDIERLKSVSKQPPNAIEVEASVLGGMMIDTHAVPKAIEILKPEYFYSKKHSLIFDAMCSLFDSSEPIDAVTLYEELKKSGKIEEVGGAAYLSQLSQDISSAANIEYHSRIVLEKWILRQLITTSMNIAGSAYEGTEDVLDLMDIAESKIFQIAESTLKESYKSMDKAVREAIEHIEAIHAQEMGSFSVPTGFIELDNMLGGFQKSDLIIVAARPSMGKCLGKGTAVLMHDGTVKPVEEIKIGELIMGNDSTPRRVLSIARGREMMYWVRQKHGNDYRVNESHILSLKRSRNEGPHNRGDVVNIEVREYLKKSSKWKSNYKGYKTSVEFEYQDVPVDPYLLGLWLGDGKSDCSRVYTQDEEIVEYLEEYAEANNLWVSVLEEKDKCPAYTITGGRSQKARDNSIQAELRKLNLLNNKHIPQIYLTNNKRIRLQLLAGLIDSDGYNNSNHGGTYEITSKNKELVYQIKFLCDTLGYRTSIKSKRASITSIGFEGIVWRVRFNGNVDEIPCKVKRKVANEWIDYRDWQVNGITVEQDKVDDYYGFEVDGNRLFLLGDCTVTHNTAFALSVARNAAVDHQVPIAIFSLEMATIQLVTRLICAEARINAHKVRTGKFNVEEGPRISRTAHKLSQAPIYIDDTPAQSVLEIRAKARRLKAEKGVGMIMIDYLQLMVGAGREESREREISNISRSLKALAKELNIPVIALSQLNRAVEQSSDKRPMLSHLRESGAIEQDADVVLFLYRPEAYGITQLNDVPDTTGYAEVIIGKQRNGPIGEVGLQFIKDYARFENRELIYTEVSEQIEEAPEEDLPI